jgi:hypothetical protein
MAFLSGMVVFAIVHVVTHGSFLLHVLSPHTTSIRNRENANLLGGTRFEKRESIPEVQ